jgi:hypothetical protein
VSVGLLSVHPGKALLCSGVCCLSFYFMYLLREHHAKRRLAVHYTDFF